MLKITGHPNGRVFMAGKDGNLYELTYTVAYGFLYSVFFVGDPAGARKCERLKHQSKCGPSPFNSLLAVFGVQGAPRTLVDVVVDPLRNVLYTLDLEGKIDMFDLGADGNQTTGKVRRFFFCLFLFIFYLIYFPRPSFSSSLASFSSDPGSHSKIGKN